MQHEHTVKSFEDELKTLDRLIAEMGGLAEEQFSTAIEAMINRDVDTAMAIKKSDKNIDALAHEIDTTSIRMLALRQPMGQDLRSIVVALKTAAVIERIGDHAKNTAKRTKVLAESPPIGAIKTVERMSLLVQEMISDVLDAYSKRDADKAADVRRRDEEVDDLHTRILRLRRRGGHCERISTPAVLRVPPRYTCWYGPVSNGADADCKSRRIRVILRRD